jgi:mannose-6-phosphate isomerase-like protein (cupin superfamily)
VIRRAGTRPFPPDHATISTGGPMIKQFEDLAVAPETYADYRPIFETKRLNTTHVRIHPGETVPTHTHLDEDQVYYVATGTGFVVLDVVRTDV